MISITLSDYPRITVSDQLPNLKQSPQPVKAIETDYYYKGRHYKYEIRLLTTKPYFGGTRYWWQCPGCGKRVAVLYCAGYCVCRHCIGAKYQTQHLQPLDRKFKRIATLRSRLGWYGGIAYGAQGKPKGMHYRTYHRLLGEYYHTANKVLQMTLDQLPKGLSDDLQNNS